MAKKTIARDIPVGSPSKLDADVAVRIRSMVLMGILSLMVLYTLYFAASLVIPIVFAVLLNLVFSPVVRALNRLRVPSALGALLVIITIVGVLAAAIYGLMEPASKWVREAPAELRRLEYKLAWVKKPIEELNEAKEQVKEITDIDGRKGESQQKVVSSSAPSLVDTVSNRAPEVAYGIAVMLILLFFLLSSGDALLAKMVQVTPRLADKKRVVETAREIQRHISLYLGTITLINIVLGVAVGFALYLLGVPNPVLWGVLVGTLNYIPYLGAAISIVIVTFVSLLTFDSPAQILMPGLVIFSANIVEGQILTPIITGQRLAMSPVAVFLALVVLGWIWGLIGVLMAVPILVCIKLVCEQIDSLKPVAVFLSRH